MSIATQAQKSKQSAVMAASAQATDNPLVMSFSRFTSMVAGVPCTQATHPNGHLDLGNASICAQQRAESFLATLPQDTTQDQATQALGEVQVFTLDRYMCLTQAPEQDWTPGQPLPQKCAFGHKTQAQALKCVGTQASTQAKVASQVKVTLGGSLASFQATQEATQASTQEATQATQEATQAPTPGPRPQAPKLKSGSQGNTGRA